MTGNNLEILIETPGFVDFFWAYESYCKQFFLATDNISYNKKNFNGCTCISLDNQAGTPA